MKCIVCKEPWCELPGGDYKTEIVSVHDPDEYLSEATTEKNRQKHVYSSVCRLRE